MENEDEEVFYDSLDELDEDFEVSPSDITLSLPLYTGETPKNQIAPKIKKQEKHPKPQIKYRNKTTKSYLGMYYEKIKRLQADGSATTRAVCEELSPKREADLEADLKTLPPEIQSQPQSDRDFYENVLAEELNKSGATAPDDDTCSLKSKRSSTTERRFYFGSCSGDNTDKLKLLKKRQSYGTKMSMKNRIKLEEQKALRKIKNSKIDQ